MPWSGFHTKMIAALGCAWILDGLEITVASSVTSILTNEDTLGLSSSEAGLIATVYLIGQVLGALFFGRMADRFGRRKLFLLTFGVYMFGSGLTALTFGQGPGWDAYLYLTRFIAGAGIGGEYAAINSAIQEMMPARFRGGWTCWSTAPTGPVPSSAPSPSCSFSATSTTARPGASAFCWGRCWGSRCCSYAAICRRALAG